MHHVIPAKAGIQFKHTFRTAGKTQLHFELPRWIPAYAGMTVLF